MDLNFQTISEINMSHCHHSEYQDLSLIPSGAQFSEYGLSNPKVT